MGVVILFLSLSTAIRQLSLSRETDFRFCGSYTILHRLDFTDFLGISFFTDFFPPNAKFLREKKSSESSPELTRLKTDNKTCSTVQKS